MHKKILLLSFLAILSVLTQAQPVNAQPVVAPQPCDPQFYKQMTSRAWLESEREIMQNQNLIFKADSVLEYTCFDRFANVTAHAGGNIFTHTAYFGGGALIPRDQTYGLEHILQNIIGASLAIYRGSNFDHALLGGRGHHVGLDVGLGHPFSSAPATGNSLGAENQGTFFDPITLPLDYACPVMAKVWETAKCLNFVHNDSFTDTDGYYPFTEIECAPGQDGCSAVAGYDTIIETRKFPESMACDPAALGTRWHDERLLAENSLELSPQLYEFQTPLGEIFLDVLDRTIPGLCGRAGIETGVTVVLSTGPAHEDGVCTNPGCTYTSGGLCSAGGGAGGTGANGVPASL